MNLIATGDHVEINASVVNSRLYQNLTDGVSMMAVYDAKNAKLCTIFQGEGLTHREPVLDEPDFERFLQTIEPLMQGGRDILWLLVGRTDSNAVKAKKVLRTHGFKNVSFYLTYNTKLMHQYGHWKRQRGIANSKSIEQLWCCYKQRKVVQNGCQKHF